MQKSVMLLLLCGVWKFIADLRGVFQGDTYQRPKRWLVGVFLCCFTAVFVVFWRCCLFFFLNVQDFPSPWPPRQAGRSAEGAAPAALLPTRAPRSTQA